MCAQIEGISITNQHIDVVQMYQKHKNGDCNVPSRYNQNQQLGRWVKNQRTYFRLVEIGFELELRSTENFLLWERQYKHLSEYRRKNGHCNVPTKYKENKQLGNWVMSQHAKFRGGKLSVEQQNRLSDIGFEWELGFAEKFLSWEHRYEQLLEYKRNNGHCNVPLRYERSANSIGKKI